MDADRAPHRGKVGIVEPTPVSIMAATFISVSTKPNVPLLKTMIFTGSPSWRTEVQFYLKNQQPFGLPLDSRKTYTKLDWITWSATLADSRAEFEQFVAPVHRFMRGTPDRVPLSDWYETTDGKQVGFQARAVVGGVYMKMLAEPDLWAKWAGRAQHK
jgi:hypothetical protein